MTWKILEKELIGITHGLMGEERKEVPDDPKLWLKQVCELQLHLLRRNQSPCHWVPEFHPHPHPGMAMGDSV